MVMPNQCRGVLHTPVGVRSTPLPIVFLFALFGGLFIWLLKVVLPTSETIVSLFSSSNNLELLLIQNYTLSRIAMALLAGGILGVASLLLQQVMNNPLASDNTLGISAGSQFALFMVAIFAPQWLENGSSVVAMVGAALSLLLVLGLALRKTVSPLILILAGLVVNLYFGSFSALMMLFYPEESRGLALWGAGSLTQESWYDSGLLALQAIVPFALLALLIRPFSILSLNDSNAQSLGVPVAKLRLIGVLISAFLIAAVVSKVGMLGFIGLAAATLVRQLSFRHFKGQLLGAFALGSLLLGITDLALQLLAHYRQIQLPTGAVTALLGTPLLLWLMFRAMAHNGRITEQGQANIRPFRPAITSLLIALSAVIFLIALLLGKGASGWFWAEISQNTALLELRYPRILTTVSVGILLAVAGVILQRLTQNPMASPELLGVSSGTSIGMLIVLFFFSVQSQSGLWIAGIIGAMVALLMIMAINQRSGMLPEKVLLTGISLSALFDSLQRIAIASGDPRAFQLVAWTSGSTQQASGSFSLIFCIVSISLLAVSLIFSRWLTLFNLQAPTAQALGLNLMRSRLVLILFSALLTAIATLIIGPLSFIGLLIPQISRMLGVVKARQQLLISALLGAMVMVLADWMGRQILFPYEIPAGLVATLIGGTYFLVMVRRV